jgi:acetyl/propionyl-CoA carboxylase alpha subunit
MYEAAERVAKAVQYASAGTFEFIVDGQGHYYFLEMNTRLQVEHPVTEWVTGVDLVEWQLLLASGEFVLPAVPERRGSAIEVRLYAEDPHSFLPAPGPLGTIQMPQGAFVRADSAFTDAGEVSLHYDPMIAKISVWGSTRDQAINRLRVALDETRVQPPRRVDGSVQGSLRTNLNFLKRLVRNSTVRGGNTTTDLIARHPELTQAVEVASSSDTDSSLTWEAAVGVCLAQFLRNSPSREPQGTSFESPWSLTARREGVRE